MTEHQLQLECIAVYRNEKQRHGLGVIIPVPNELAAKRKDIEICVGASDIITVSDKVRFNELKVGYNVQSPAQKMFQHLVESLGYEYHLIRSVQQFKTANRL